MAKIRNNLKSPQGVAISHVKRSQKQVIEKLGRHVLVLFDNMESMNMRNIKRRVLTRHILAAA